MDFKRFLFAGLFLLFCVTCSKSDEQKEFEEAAFSAPGGITRTTATAGVVQTDPDDWRISPMYQGLIRIDVPAYPNPVSVNSTFRIDINFLVNESAPDFIVYAFNTENGPTTLVFPGYAASPPIGLDTIELQPSGFIQNNSMGVYRLIALDGRDNVITYGDVEIQ